MAAASVVVVAKILNRAAVQRLQEARENVDYALETFPDCESLKLAQKCLNLVWNNITFRTPAEAESMED